MHLLSTDGRPEPPPHTTAQPVPQGHRLSFVCERQIIKCSNVKQKLFSWYSQILHSDVIGVIEMGPHVYTTAFENTTEAYSEMLNNVNIEVVMMMWVYKLLRTNDAGQRNVTDLNIQDLRKLDLMRHIKCYSVVGSQQRSFWHPKFRNILTCDLLMIKLNEPRPQSHPPPPHSIFLDAGPSSTLHTLWANFSEHSVSPTLLSRADTFRTNRWHP